MSPQRDGTGGARRHDNMALPEADLVVVGSGAAGLTAAIVAQRRGMRVVVLEKDALVGGTTAVSGGVGGKGRHFSQSGAGMLGLSDKAPDTSVEYITVARELAPARLRSSRKTY